MLSVHSKHIIEIESNPVTTAEAVGISDLYINEDNGRVEIDYEALNSLYEQVKNDGEYKEDIMKRTDITEQRAADILEFILTKSDPNCPTIYIVIW